MIARALNDGVSGLPLLITEFVLSEQRAGVIVRWKSVIILSGYCCVSSQTTSVDRVDRTSQLVDRPLFAVLRNEGRPPRSLEARKLNANII